MTQQECSGLKSRLGLHRLCEMGRCMAQPAGFESAWGETPFHTALQGLVSGHQKEMGAGGMKILLQTFFLLHFGSLVQAKARQDTTLALRLKTYKSAMDKWFLDKLDWIKQLCITPFPNL